ncbi:SAM-dependent methyltransferase [Kineosporia succinea]|uniref:SAM-dependent MidA family methyltransferase n=1 Tax=Kineosporia succinea TaxID=84632 RepID=A0ABT9P2Y8_9ACTN|nr:SAM-dependent methyltransferase [Kineosporia succinea]MDP9827048.1 SAM-dependent MidA family methyltransferase [Kineosporia succinea]
MRLWRDAWQTALYGPDGFYRRPEGPAGHFRTASHAAPGELGQAVSRLAASLGASRLVDVGAGRGELLTALVGSSLELWGVDVVARPTGLSPSITWAQMVDALPDAALEGALVVAWELLDVIPVNVLEVDERGRPRPVLVDPRTGRESLGGRASTVDLAWTQHWWPADGLEEGDRIEVGLPRDRFWRSLLERASRAGAVAALCVDYAHTRIERPNAGSLTGFSRGRAVPPRPDGSMDVTAHVAIDSVLAAWGSGTLTTQARALAQLGVSDAELLDPGGLGGFAWLLCDL